MVRTFGVPISWLLLTHNKPRLATAVAGVAFAVLLMFMEIGFLNGLYDSATELAGRFRAEIVLAARGRFAMTAAERLARWRIVQARAVPGVASAFPLYIEYQTPLWKNRSDRTTQPIRV